MRQYITILYFISALISIGFSAHSQTKANLNPDLILQPVVDYTQVKFKEATSRSKSRPQEIAAKIRVIETLKASGLKAPNFDELFLKDSHKMPKEKRELLNALYMLIAVSNFNQYGNCTQQKEILRETCIKGTVAQTKKQFYSEQSKETALDEYTEAALPYFEKILEIF